MLRDHPVLSTGDLRPEVGLSQTGGKACPAHLQAFTSLILASTSRARSPACCLPIRAPTLFGSIPRGVRAFEGVAGAATATFRAHDGKAERPVYTAIPIPSVYAAFQAAVSITIALNARQRSGVGQRIEVPLFDSMFPSIGSRGMYVHD